jgi:hypothetical protein
MDEDQFSNFNQEYMHIGDDNVVLGHIMLNVMGVETSGHIEKHHFLKLFAYLKYRPPHAASPTRRNYSSRSPSWRAS